MAESHDDTVLIYYFGELVRIVRNALKGDLIFKIDLAKLEVNIQRTKSKGT